MALSSLIISIKADDMATSVIKSVADSVKSFAAEISRVAFTNIVNGIEDATLTLGKFQMELELTDIAFTQMIKGADRGMHSMEEYTNVAKALRNELHDLAAETPFSFLSVNKAARQLMAYGFALHDIVPMLRNIGDAAAAFGGSPVVIDRIVRALGQIRTYGRLKGQELLQLTEAGVPAHQILAEELGLTREQLSRIADQHIPAEDAIKAILTGIQKRYEGMMEVQSRTLKGSIEAIRDNFLLVATQLTETIYSEFSSGIQGFRRNLDQWKNMTRAYGWRGMFGRQVFYDKNEREVNVSKLSKEEIQDKIQKGELRREFDPNRYIDRKGKLADLTGLSQDEIAFKEAKGDITKQGPLIPLDWQKSIFTFGDYILELIKRIKELGNSLGRLWNTLFGGTDGFSDIGYAIFRMINGFIVFITLVSDVATAFVSFSDTLLEAGSTGRFFEAVLIGIFAAIEMAAIVTLIEKFAMLAATFQVVIGFAGIIGVQFGAMIGIAYLVGQSSEDAAAGVLAVGTALMIIANRAMIAGAAIMAWNAVLNASRAIVAGVTAVWTSLIAVYTTFRTTITALITLFAGLRAAIIAGTAVSVALHTAVVGLNLIFGSYSLIQITTTAAVVAGTAAMIAARVAYAAFEVVVGSLVGVMLIFEGSATAATVATGLWSSVVIAATTVTSIFSGAVTILSAVMTVARAKMLLIIGVIALVVAALYNAFDTVKEAVNALFTAIANAFAKLINWFLEKLSSWSKAAYDGFVDTFAAIGRSVSGLLGRVFSSLWNDTSTFVKGILQRLGPLGKLIGEIGTKVSNAWNSAVSPDGSMLGKVESFVTGLFAPKDIGGLDQYPDSYYNVQPVESGEPGGGGKGKKGKNKTDKANQPTEHTYTIPIGQAIAEFVTTLESIDQPFDSLVSNAYALSKGLSDANGNLTKEYFAGKAGTAEDNSALHKWGSDYAPQKGDLIYLKDGSVAIYMGDGKVRTGAPGEVTKELVERMVAAPAQLSQPIQSQSGISPAFQDIINGNLEGTYYVRQQGSVNTSGLHADAKQMLNFVSWLYYQENGERLVLTEAYDPTGSRHNPNSWHYYGQAIDINDSFDGATSNGFITTNSGAEGSFVGFLKSIVQRAGGRYLFEGDHLHVTIPDGAFDITEAYRIYQELLGNKDSFISADNATITNTPPINALRTWADSLSGGMRDDVFDSLVRNAQEYGLSVQHVIATALAESGGNPNVVSPVGALGVMQLMPSTAAILGVDPYNIEENIRGGVQFLKTLFDTYGDWDVAHAAYNAGQGAVDKYGGIPPYRETQAYVANINNFLSQLPENIGELGQQFVKITEAQAKLNLTPIENIADQIAYIASISEATGGETFVKKVMQIQAQAKATGEYYKEQEKANKVLSEYNAYMQEANKQIALNDGTLTNYRKNLMDMRDSYFQSLGKVQKLLGEGLSPELATKMVNKAKEVFDSTLKEFERKRTVQLNVEFKSNMIKSLELNHKFAQSLSMQKELNRIKWKEDMSTYGREHLQDASKLPEILDKILSGVSVQSLFSRSENNPYSEWVKSNDTESIKAMLSEIIVSLKEIYLEETKLENTTYSRTVESYANQNDLQGFISYNKSDAGKQALITEEAYNANKQWIELLKEDFASLGERIDQVMMKAHNSIIEHGTNVLMDMIKGTKSAKEAFKEFALSVLEDMAKIAIRAALMNAVGNIFSGITGGKKIPWFAEGGHVTKGETILVGEEGPELLSVTRNKSALGNPHTQVVGSYGPEFITAPYSGYIISNNDVSKMFGYYSDSSPMSYIINGFRAQGGDVKKGEAYIVGEQGPEVFSPGQSGSIMSNNQLNSTLNNLERITNAGTMSNPQEGAPVATIPPVVVNLDNKSGHQMEAEATSDFDGEKWVISVVMDAVRRNVNGMRNIIGNVAGKR